MTAHFHVVTFQQGCLNDSDSGPIETEADAITFIDEFIKGEDEAYASFGLDGWSETSTTRDQVKRYQRGLSVCAIERCDQNCEQEA